MSNVDISERKLNCQVFQLEGIGEPPVELDKLRLLDKVLEAQYDEAEEELGDSLVIPDDEKLREIQAAAGTHLNDASARTVVSAVIGCLQQRYLGNCAAAGNCSGRELIDARLAVLGISRFKEGAQV